MGVQNQLKFRHIATDPNPIGTHHPVCLVGDFEGNGFQDVMIGFFTEFLVDSGKPTHEAKLIDLGNRGASSIVGKPFYPSNQVDLWKNLIL